MGGRVSPGDAGLSACGCEAVVANATGKKPITHTARARTFLNVLRYMCVFARTAHVPQIRARDAGILSHTRLQKQYFSLEDRRIRGCSGEVGEFRRVGRVREAHRGSLVRLRESFPVINRALPPVCKRTQKY